MLTISKALSSGQAQSYHKLEFTSETQNYYKQGETVKGEWQGKLAASLGLSGEVAPLEFSRLADGQHPQTEEQMVKHRAAQESSVDGSTTKPSSTGPGGMRRSQLQSLSLSPPLWAAMSESARLTGTR